ncbi:PREDICTED: MATH domain and coiled-coil domain-containing protein At3g58410-like [Camelina sativa]|uniref:MATH domain and coiled-coil domain-containing protein At3g58410-like n=1 Tax=Camelina sativa TaxID=90675 RepID=A0ABM0YXM1_CAMSA|nr:PREDICTED: MATH domain and coiled-coil domain-containing protein At3g58410-like [Camelina sativa]
MAKQVGKRFAWVIKDFLSLQCDWCYSAPVLIGDCKWRLCAFPKGRNVNYMSLFLEAVDFESLPSGWRRYVKIRLTIVKQVSEEQSVIREMHRWFDQEQLVWGFPFMLSLTKLQDEKHKFLISGELMIVADVEVLEVIGTFDETEEEIVEASEPQITMKLDDGAKSSIDINGFQVLPLQVESVRRIFEKHPDIAIGFYVKNQHLRKTFMNFLVNVIETLCQPLEELSNEDIVEADIALTYVKDAGFKVDWLEKKLEAIKEKKVKEQSGLAQLQEMEDNLLKLKQSCSDLDALVEKKKAELSVTRSPLSFDDILV